MNKKTALISILLTVTIILAGCSATGNVIKEEKLEKITVRLPIPIINVAFLPYFTAVDQGYYEEEGLDVEYVLGSSQLNPTKMVASGVDEIGIVGGPDTMLVARSHGHPLVAVAIIHQDSDFPVLVAKKESGITSVKDLEGKKVGFFHGHISTDVFHHLLNKYDIEYEEVDVGFNFAQLISGNVDAQWAWRVNMPKELEKQGTSVNIISPKAHGVNVHGYTVFVKEDFLNNHPDVIEKYLRATFKGVKFATEHPEIAIKSIISRSPELDEAFELAVSYEYSEVTNGNNGFTYGYLDDAMMRETYNRLAEEGVLGNKFDVADSFDDSFIKRFAEE